ncbi:hypothetical protein BGZ76_011699 [Entomortierella beljakovae]|nr:hypothetical protein BGZ76_011699 [Entomortierella beljakovae]
MYSTSFTQPPLQDSSQQHPHPVYPFPTPELSPHQTQQIEYQFNETIEPQSENQILQQRSQDISHTFYSSFSPVQGVYQYPASQPYENNNPPLFLVSRPMAAQPEYWHQHASQYPPQPIYNTQSVSTEPLSPNSSSGPWRPVEYGDKDLIISPKPLNDLTLVVNPAHTLRSIHDNNDAEHTENDVEGRVQLSSGGYFPKSSPPPLSPSSDNLSGQNSQGQNHNQTSPLTLLKSMANLSTSTPGANHTSPNSTIGTDGFFSNPDYGHTEPVSHPSLSITSNEEKDDDDEVEGFDDDGDDDDEGDHVFCSKPAKDEESDDDGGPERPFQCSSCDKNFKRQYNLNAHVKTHSEERTHICPTCHRSFLRPYDLSRHQRIHTKVKPYKCGICSDIFIRNDAIWRHYRKAHLGHPDVPVSRRTKNKNINPNSIVGALVSRSPTDKVPKFVN